MVKNVPPSKDPGSWGALFKKVYKSVQSTEVYMHCVINCVCSMIMYNI